MSKRDPRILLEDVLLAIEKIGRFTAGIDQHTFLIDEKTIDAVVRNLEIIGEAVRQLPDDFKNVTLIFPGVRSVECETASFMSTSVWTWRSSGKLFSTIFRTWKPASAFLHRTQGMSRSLIGVHKITRLERWGRRVQR